MEGINVHQYGAHIFHTSNKKVWDFVNSIVEFNRYTNCPVANYKGKLYNLPFNMNTFYQMWGVLTPEEAKAKIEEQKKEALAALNGREPQNLEEQALCLVGKDIFEKLIKEYTEKQWGRKCTELPAFIIKRLPVRLVFDNNYFNDKYQGIPIGGYNQLIDGLLEGIECKTGKDFFHSEYKDWKNYADKLVYTGAIDEYFGYSLGKLDWRTVSLRHVLRILQIIREMQLSIIPAMRFLIQESLNTSILKCSVKMYIIVQRRLSQKSILRNTKKAWNLIIL